MFQIKQTGKDIKKEFRSVHADHIMPNGKNWYLVFGFGIRCIWNSQNGIDVEPSK